MRLFSATDAKLRFAALIDAAREEPIIVRRNGRSVAAVISYDQYLSLHRQHIQDFQRFCDRIAETAATRGLNAPMVAEILADGT